MTTLHPFLDWTYGDDGDVALERSLREGADPDAVAGEAGETPLHVAARRRREGAHTPGRPHRQPGRGPSPR